MEIDPTRPVMIDGGNALTDPQGWKGTGPWVEPAREMGYLPINGGHYTEDGYGVSAADFPDSFYTAEDFFTWANGHLSYTRAYLKPNAGAFPILEAGAALAFTPLVEAQTDNNGLFILNQTLALTKLDEDPAARRLTDQLINHAFDYEPLHRQVVEAIPEDSLMATILREAELKSSRASDPLAAMRATPGGVVLARATPATLAELSAHLDEVKAFRQNGGWIVLYDVTPAEREAFNQLVGVEHLMRPGTREAMAVVLPREPMATGVNMNDVVMTTGKKISWWKGTEFRSHEGYSYVVDYRDVLPFATINGSEPQRLDSNMPHPRNVANGLSGEEFWRYLSYFEGDMERRMVFDLPREESIDTFEIAFDTGYSTVETFTLDFHDGGEVLEFEAAPGTAPQSFTFDPRRTDKVTFQITEYDINDFFAADTPTVIALAGEGSPVETEKVKNIPVNRKAEALFFLHTYQPGKQAERVDNQINKAILKGETDTLVTMDYPTVLEYVVHYADGSEAVIPVRYRREIGPWIDETLPETNAYSRVAWQAAASDADAFITVYSMQWNNPEPAKEIKSLDIRIPEGDKNIRQLGAPAVFAISTATVQATQ